MQLDQSLAALFADHQLYHSDFQMDFLITVRAGGTAFGCYKQSLRELFRRHHALQDLADEREVLLIDIDEIETRPATDHFERRRQEVTLRQKRRALGRLEFRIAETQRECDHFRGQAERLKSEVGKLTPERRAALDWQMWEHRLRCLAATDFASTGHLKISTITMLQAMPIDTRKRLADEILNPANHMGLLTWFLNYEPQPTGRISDADDRPVCKIAG